MENSIYANTEHHSPAETTPAATNIIRYTAAQLRALGEKCAGRPPPPTTIYSIFAYEFMRKTEAEKLFRGHMFDLAGTQEQASTNESRFWEMEDQIAGLRKQLMSKDVEDRLATSNMRYHILQTKNLQQDRRVEGHGKRLAELEAKLSDVAEMKMQAELDTLNAKVTAYKTDIDMLFQERDSLADQLDEASKRIAKLENTIRLLTVKSFVPGEMWSDE
ncbi:uncharacterized protein LTR77_007472 [Saxophila tyrrhenica]|uniref:PPC89 centrosome localisation domain-containing protein n=1 Tax=Saxophila tyrrhenica TaxID=1690608 RepID=A0AAV9P588_9PEZI|nr:hypothetical protein LTR77_007472 [Saxophila tyrrhenica]